MLNPEKDIEDMCTMSLFLLQEIRYTCGSNRQIILEVIKFLCLADGLRDRIVCFKIYFYYNNIFFFVFSNKLIHK